MLLGEHSPAIIGMNPKSRYNEITKAKAIQDAIQAARGIPRPMPVVHGRKIVGLVQGKSFTSDLVRFIPIDHGYKFGWGKGLTSPA